MRCFIIAAVLAITVASCANEDQGITPADGQGFIPATPEEQAAATASTAALPPLNAVLVPNPGTVDYSNFYRATIGNEAVICVGSTGSQTECWRHPTHLPLPSLTDPYKLGVPTYPPHFKCGFFDRVCAKKGL